ncbi:MULTISPECIES: hypothetical protein [Olivibacter]|uniref:Uncharacterized protein n=1 Tax=Olivibacter jilunii TaxID=985016 RepID=A0ABW6B2T6_9SPHI
MEYSGIISIDFEGRTVSINYNVIYFDGNYYIDITDKHNIRHRFRHYDDTNEWRYTSLRPLKWRYDFVIKLFKAMDSVLKEITPRTRA